MSSIEIRLEGQSLFGDTPVYAQHSSSYRRKLPFYPQGTLARLQNIRLKCKLLLSNETEGILRVLKVNVVFFADGDKTFWSEYEVAIH